MSLVARCPQCGSIDLSYVGLACRTYKNDWHQHFTERGHEGGEVRDSYFYETGKEERELAERIAELEQQLTEARAENERLKAPVTFAEMRIGQAGNPGTFGPDSFDRVIAARVAGGKG